jgi:hypothetical protein
VRLAVVCCLLAACAGDAMLDPDAGELPDASLPDAGSPDADPRGAVVYTTESSLSPLTEDIADRLRRTADVDKTLRNNVFAKVGASNTVYNLFLHCFAGSNIDLDGRTELQAAIDHFRTGDAAGTTPFNRVSESATVGWSAWSALAGDPSPLEQELAAIRPRFAVIMFGTNDLQVRNITRYADNLLDMADILLARGVIPMFTSIPPLEDADDNVWVPRYNAVSRAVAQARQVPYMDLHRELIPLDGWGLQGDGVHMNASPDGACQFTAAGLGYGFNNRNLLTITMLERMRAMIVDGAAAPDTTVTRRRGSGTEADPVIVDGFPFTDVRNTRTGGTDRIDLYPGCAAIQDEQGHEVLYRMVLTERKTLRIMVFDRGTVDIDVHLLNGTDGDGCLARDHQLLTQTLEPGTYHLSLDTFTSSDGTENAGEYLLVIVEEP